MQSKKEMDFEKNQFRAAVLNEPTIFQSQDSHVARSYHVLCWCDAIMTLAKRAQQHSADECNGKLTAGEIKAMQLNETRMKKACETAGVELVLGGGPLGLIMAIRKRRAIDGLLDSETGYPVPC